MKYLIRYPKRTAIALGAVVMTAINLYRAFKTGEISTEQVIAFFTAVFTLLGLYFNIPTSDEGAKHTDLMMLEKLYNTIGTDGEDFFNEFVEEDEEGDFAEELEDIEDGDLDG